MPVKFDREFYSLRDLIETSAKLFNDKPMYVYKRKKQELVFTYRDALETMNAIGTAFCKLGLAGKTIAIIGDTDPYYVMTYYAAVCSNGIAVPLDKELPEEEIINFVNRSGAEAVVYTSRFNGVLAPEADQMPKVNYYIPIESETETTQSKKVLSMDTVLDFGKAALASGDTSFTSIETNLEAPCAIIFTSGTTGTSKGVTLCERNLVSAGNASSKTMSTVNSTTNLLCVLPINHTYEMTTGHIASFHKGTTTYINDSLKYISRNLQKAKPSALVLVPLFVETLHKKIFAGIEAKGMTEKVRKAMKMSNAMRKVGIDLRKKLFGQILEMLGGNLTTIICGGAALDPELIADFDALGIEILEGYGITECSPLVAVNTHAHKKIGSVGRAVPCCKFKTDAEDGVSEGEVLVKGDNVMLGYYNDPEASAEAFDEDGWFRTGDIGHVDKNSFLYLTGRKKNIIILSNGKNIYPEEIEYYLYKIGTISECVVLGKPNASGEVVITAIVYPDFEAYGDKPAAEILDDLKARVNEINKQLPIYKQVREVELRDTEFEKTTTRKIKRYKVR